MKGILLTKKYFAGGSIAYWVFVSGALTVRLSRTIPRVSVTGALTVRLSRSIPTSATVDQAALEMDRTLHHAAVEARGGGSQWMKVPWAECNG